jgi:hypothetical protein
MGLVPVVQWTFADATSAYSAGPGQFVRANSSAAPLTITMPKAVACPGRKIGIKAVNATNAITISAASGETIDGAPSALIGVGSTNEYLEFISDGAVWWIT